MRTTVRTFGMVTTFEAIKSLESRVRSSESKARTCLDSGLRTPDSRLFRAAQRQQRDFGQAAVTDGQDDRAEAACDVNLRLAAAAEAAKYPAADAPRGRALGAPGDLTAVRVAGE